MMDAQREDVLHTLKHYDSVEMQRLLKTEDIMEEYNTFLSKYRYDHVLMEQQDFYEALGDDAVSMANKYHLFLWDRDAGSGQSVPMVMLSMDQVDRVLSESDDVLKWHQENPQWRLHGMGTAEWRGLARQGDLARNGHQIPSTDWWS